MLLTSYIVAREVETSAGLLQRLSPFYSVGSLPLVPLGQIPLQDYQS